jgi:hypothetical protein
MIICARNPQTPHPHSFFPKKVFLKISDRDPNGFAGKQQSISGRLAAQLVNPLR